jgi:hypothetical protein
LITGIQDQRVQLERDVLLQGVDVLDVVGELPAKPLLVYHVLLL